MNTLTRSAANESDMLSFVGVSSPPTAEFPTVAEMRQGLEVTGTLPPELARIVDGLASLAVKPDDVVCRDQRQ